MLNKLKKRLERFLEPDQILFKAEDRIAYSYDASKLQGMPLCVVRPEEPKQVVEILKLASEEKIPVYPRGAGSGMVGGAVPTEPGIVVSFEKMNRIIELDEDNMVCEVEPGIVTGHLQEVVSSKGLFYPPDPSSLKFSTIGGNVATGAGGPRAVKYGVTRDYVMAIESVLPSGKIIRTGSYAIKSVVGYDLTKLLVGSEGTLALFTKILLRLIPLPDPPWLVFATFPTSENAARTVTSILKQRVLPSAIEFMDKHILQAISDNPYVEINTNAGSALIFEIDDMLEIRQSIINKIDEVCRENGTLSTIVASDDEEKDRIWNARRSISPALAKIRKGKINEDVAVPRQSLPDFLIVIEKISKRYGIPIPVFGHAGDGNLHVNIMYDPDNAAERESAKRATIEMFSQVLKLRGTISGEHGIGIAKSPFIRQELGHEVMELMWRVKLAFDPMNILNPGKIFIPNRAFIN